jgi:hypothetical protein
MATVAGLGEKQRRFARDGGVPYYKQGDVPAGVGEEGGAC